MISGFFRLTILSLLLLSALQLISARPAEASVDLQLTAEEHAWLADHPVVNVRIDGDYPPFGFLKNGQYQGISLDYLELLSKRLGLTFHPVDNLLWEEALDSIRKKNGVDLVLVITHSDEREEWLNFTRNYISFPEVIYTRKNFEFVSGFADLQGRLVATESGFIESEMLLRDIPEVSLFKAESTEDALKAVAVGNADAYIGNLAVGSYLIDKLGLVNLKVAAPSLYGEDPYAMAVRKDWPVLARILDKGLESITAKERHEINNRWLSIRYEHGLQVQDIIMWVTAAVLISLVFIVQLRRMVKRRTRELQELHDSLESLVEERTSELHATQKELVRSERLALLGQLTSTVSHELRNPLGSISNTLFSLVRAIETGDSEKANRAVEVIERNSMRCDRIVSELLDFTRRPMVDTVEVSIDQWLESVLREYRWADGITQSSELQCRVKRHIDPESLRRAVSNLLDNAVHAVQSTASKTGEVAINCRTKDSRIEIRVSDTGGGMSEDVLSKIFEPLFSTKSFGIGLGVPIVRNIMQEHGGGLTYESQPDKGTTAILWLPIADPF